MPLVIPRDIPAFEALKNSIFVMDTKRANTQDIRPLELLIVNLMPLKIDTENQILSLLANSPLQVHISFISTQSYVGKNTPKWHLEKFYEGIESVKNRHFDGAIVTGAPVECLEFADVKYWDELCEIYDFLRQNVTSTMYICWGAMSALYRFYGVSKRILDKKCFGVFRHELINPDLILTNLGSRVLMPHSRHSHIDESILANLPQLKVLLKSDIAGVSMLRDKKDIFVLGHPEYFKDTLELEYQRDTNKGLENKNGLCVEKPQNYYDNGRIDYSWRSDANTIFSNWLNYDVYQSTPFVL